MHELKYQSGQSLLLVVAFSTVLMMTLLFVFNSAQLLSERQNAKIIADQAAYATGVRQARLLNLNAYINRTQIANQLAIAQVVSMGSWTKFLAMTAQNGGVKATELFPPAIVAMPALISASNSLSSFANSLGSIIQPYGFEVKMIEDAQSALNYTSSITVLMTPSDFLRSSGKDNEYQASLSILGSQFAVNPLSSITPLKSFIQQYTAKNRQGMADIIKSSESGFVASRYDWNFHENILPIAGYIYLPIAMPPDARLTKKGGTELVNLDEWKAVDTMSIHISGKAWGTCGPRFFRYACPKNKSEEIPIGFGSAATASPASNQGVSLRSRFGSGFGSGSGGVSKDLDPKASYNSGTGYANSGSNGANPKATAQSQSFIARPNWDINTSRAPITGVGVPNYYNLTPSSLAQNEPAMPLTVKIQKNRNRLGVASRASNLITTGNVELKDNFDDLENGTAGNGNMVAITRSEVYFRRPWDQPNMMNGATSLEKASLYSPYWQVRLTDDISSADREKIILESLAH